MEKKYIIIDKVGNNIYEYKSYENMEWQLKGLIWSYETHGWIIKQTVYNNGSIVALRYVKDMFD